ncbi:hypothetical protein [Gryllotalpicola koreensis]|uniref:Uncharacterized protein n=1 Tax=Gryllotalpicola koreensis TaxID=993086 RepID=A0ABP8A1Q3_9MICO
MADYTDAQRKQMADAGQAMPDGSYPIKTTEDLRNAIRAVGRGNDDHTAIRKFIIRRAKALNATTLLPKSWKPDGTIWTMASDHAYDKAHGIKEGSPADMKLDASRGLSK